MDTFIIDGKKLAAEIQEDIKNQVQKCKRAPTLAVILVGDDPASLIYVRNKKKQALNVGIQTPLFHLSPVITTDALISFVKELNENDQIDGILVQMPLPAHIDSDAVLEAISPDKDADGLTTANLGRLFVGKPALNPCTPKACMELINTVQKDLSGLHAVVVGRSRLVGKPVAQLLLDANCTVTQAHSKSKNLEQICKTADILIVAVGKAGLIKKSFVKEGVIIIDVGINRKNDGKIVGDVDFSQMLGTARAITPVPGGVGPMTITMLLKNTLQIYLNKQT